MKNFKVVFFLPISVVLLFISGCSIIPAALQVPENTVLTHFSQVRENADAQQGNLARWGGVIAKVVNNTDNTMLEVVHFPLKSSSRPKQGNETQGRFRVYFSGLLDPMIYKEGRSITALGSISHTEQGEIGEHKYIYPVLKASYIHLWKNIEKIDVRITHDPFWYTPSYWHYPRSYYYQRAVVVRKSSATVKSK
jgi:outer membrane lipoprotein